jgi:hypothetical protein
MKKDIEKLMEKELNWKVGQKILVSLNQKSADYWELPFQGEVTVLGKVYFRNGEHHIPTDKGHYPTIFFTTARFEELMEEYNKAQTVN